MGAFDGKGMVIQGLRFLGPKEALASLQEGALLVDLRTEDLVEMKAFLFPRPSTSRTGSCRTSSRSSPRPGH